MDNIQFVKVYVDYSTFSDACKNKTFAVELYMFAYKLLGSKEIFPIIVCKCYRNIIICILNVDHNGKHVSYNGVKYIINEKYIIISNMIFKLSTTRTAIAARIKFNLLESYDDVAMSCLGSDAPLHELSSLYNITKHTYDPSFALPPLHIK